MCGSGSMILLVDGVSIVITTTKPLMTPFGQAGPVCDSQQPGEDM